MNPVAIYAYKNYVVTGQEISAQIDECTRMGYEVVAVYTDIQTGQRREELLKASRNGKFSAVIATSANRIDRIPNRFCRVIMKLLKNGVTVCFTDGADTTQYIASMKLLHNAQKSIYEMKQNKRINGGHDEK